MSILSKALIQQVAESNGFVRVSDADLDAGITQEFACDFGVGQRLVLSLWKQDGKYTVNYSRIESDSSGRITLIKCLQQNTIDSLEISREHFEDKLDRVVRLYVL